MTENVALIKKEQKSFNSTVVKYKKLLKKGELKIKEKPATKKELTALKVKKRGLVYVGNIPHGFYEEETRDYFKQFGAIKRVRVCRSKKTGKSKGYAFIEFKEPDVAKIVAETMNNYLMDKRLLKAQYISPEEQGDKNYFKGKNFTADKFPTLVNRRKHRLAKNAIVSNDKIMEKNADAVKKLHRTINKLKKLGIIYEFMPVDVPDYLTLKVELMRNDAKLKKSDSEDESELSSNVSDLSEEEDFDDDIKEEPEEEVPIKKEKLKGVTKSKTKLAKPSKLNNKKTNLIKTQISNKDQIKIKSAKMKKKSPKK